MKKVEILKANRCQNCGAQIGADFAFCAKCAGVGRVVEKDIAEDEGAGEVAGYLPKNVRRRYAKAKSVFEVGIWSAKSLDCLFGVMLGSMNEVRNSYDELRLDNRRLRFELKGLGLVYADCLCPELSPESHEFTKRDGSTGITAGSLWHSHGFMKFDERIGARDLHSVLSPLWGKIHGSQVVDVKIIYDEDKAIKYAVKDAVKNYLSDDRMKKRLFKSSGWLPEGYRKVDKMLTKWALVHRFDWDTEDSMPDKGYGPRLDFVPMVWEVRRDFLKRWCRGESISLDLGDYKVYIIGESISKYAVIKEGGDSDELL
jgi:hypothetical protein